MRFYLSLFTLIFLVIVSVQSFAKADEEWSDEDASVSYEATPDAHVADRPPVKLLWVPLNRVATFTLLKQSFEKTHVTSDGKVVQPLVQTIRAPGLLGDPINPFALANHDFRTGMQLTNSTAYGPVPNISEDNAKWFDDQVAANNLPDVFMIGGHHVISEGWHNDAESSFLYMPTLLDTLSKSDSARKIFDHVKLAVLWGCNTMTNLEPHGPNGEYLDSSEIETEYKAGASGRLSMLGVNTAGDVKTNSLEFYKQRLASEYGADSGKYEYTRSSRRERCIGTPAEPFKNCPVTNLERIMPETFLYDGTHKFNEPARMKSIFRNAYLVLGFSSASPSEEQRAKILNQVLREATFDLNQELSATHQAIQNNILYTIVADETDNHLRMKAIELVRKHWTIDTYALNRQRPSGSITPAFPKLDQNGVFNVHVSRDTPLVAPYEIR
jgi:hypothetical protein